MEDEPETDMGVDDVGELDESDYEPDHVHLYPPDHALRYPAKSIVPATANHKMVAIRELTAEQAARFFAKPGD